MLASPYLENINFGVGSADIPHILLSLLVSGDSVPAPSLRNLEVIAHGRADDSWLISATVQSVIRERSVGEHAPGAASLQRLAISHHLITGMELWYQQAVGEGGLTIIEEPPTPEEMLERS